jgi:hypothetical protein
MRNFCRTTVAASVLAAFTAAPAFAGNGAPNGPHYNLNIVGVPKAKTALMKDDGLTGKYGHVIFVKEDGQNQKIWLTQGDDFQVLDKNGTDADGATFMLPAPDPDGNGTTDYSVFARALGKPTGSATVTTCVNNPTYGLECSLISLTLNAATRPSKFTNVSKYLLYIYADVDEDTVVDRIPLFANDTAGFYWEWDNNGLKLAQLRFYQCNTTVPSATVGDVDGDTVPNTEADFILAEQLGLLTQTDNCFD